MRTLVLLGLLTLAVARPARAQPELDEPPIELGPAPPPPPGARALDPEEPSAPPVEPDAAPAAPDAAPAAPRAAPVEPIPVSLDPEPAAATPQNADRRLPAPSPSDDGGAAPGERAPARWYGWKILIADGAALVLTVSVELGPVLGGGAYLLTAPSIHLGHRRPLAALGSLSLRIAAPLVLNALIEHEPCSQDPCLPAGVLAGALVASVVDVAFLARESGDSTPKRTARITPAVRAGPKGTTVFLTGSF